MPDAMGRRYGSFELVKIMTLFAASIIVPWQGMDIAEGYGYIGNWLVFLVGILYFVHVCSTLPEAPLHRVFNRKKVIGLIVLFAIFRLSLFVKLHLRLDLSLLKASATFFMIIAVMLEEKTERGFMLEALGERTSSFESLMILSALMFSASHLNATWSEFLFRFSSGLFYAYGAFHSGGLVLPVLLHVIDNIVAEVAV